VFNSSDVPKTQESSASSLQSGLISVVLKGDDTYFRLSRASQFRMELDDVVCISIYVYIYVGFPYTCNTIHVFTHASAASACMKQ